MYFRDVGMLARDSLPSSEVATKNDDTDDLNIRPASQADGRGRKERAGYRASIPWFASEHGERRVGLLRTETPRLDGTGVCYANVLT